MSARRCSRAFHFSWHAMLPRRENQKPLLSDNVSDTFELGLPAGGAVAERRTRNCNVDGNKQDIRQHLKHNPCLAQDLQLRNNEHFISAEKDTRENDFEDDALMMTRRYRTSAASIPSLAYSSSVQSASTTPERHSFLTGKTLSLSSVSTFTCSFSEQVPLGSPEWVDDDNDEDWLGISDTVLRCSGGSIYSAAIRNKLNIIDPLIIEAGLVSQARRRSLSDFVLSSPSNPSAVVCTAIAVNCRRFSVKQVRVDSREVKCDGLRCLDSLAEPPLVTSGCSESTHSSLNSKEQRPISPNLWDRLRCRLSKLSLRTGRSLQRKGRDPDLRSKFGESSYAKT